jgi:hypothetical protein
MVTKAKPLTPAEQLEQRRQELDWRAQQQAAFEAARAERQHEHELFLRRVADRREREAAALERGEELEPPIIPTINAVYQEKAAEEMAEAERLEQERIAALDPRAVLISALTPEKRDFIARWQKANPGVTFPLEALSMH